LAALALSVETKIRGDQLKKPSDLLDEIKILKDSYNEQTKEMKFKDKEVVLQREVERLIIKGFEHLWRNMRDQSTFKHKQSEESVKYLENQVASLKKELQDNSREFSVKNDELI
jgi:hypothetical protein